MEARLKAINVPSTSVATELIFVYGYHNLPGIFEFERVRYYSTAAFQQLRLELRSYVEKQLELFSDSYDYEDYFSLAEYESPEDAITDDELPIFRSGLRAEDRDTPFRELSPRDVLRGFRAVMLERISAGELADICSAVELFNSVIECAVEAVDDRNPRSYISVETAQEFGPWFIEHLFRAIEGLEQTWRSNPFERFIGRKFRPLQPLLEELRAIVNRDGWPRSDLSLGQFLLIVEYFKKVVEEQWQF